jgi:hypothetical protein
MTQATCPKCSGTTRIPASGPNKHVMYSYDKGDDTLACDNCGGQTMMGTATGLVRVNPATGLGCIHEYKGSNAGRCLTRYVCQLCSDTYSIDSSD